MVPQQEEEDDLLIEGEFEGSEAGPSAATISSDLPTVQPPPDHGAAPALDKGQRQRLQKALKEGSWVCPISYEAESMALLLRRVLESLDCTFKRSATTHGYTKAVMIVPMPRDAYVFRFEVSEPASLTVDTYDTSPGPNSRLSYLRLEDLSEEALPLARSILRTLTAQLDRPPWKFPLGQKLQSGTGLLDPVYRTARLQWECLVGSQ